MTDRTKAQRAIALLDLTELGDDATGAQVAALCAKAAGAGPVPPVAAVCVWPRHVALAREQVPASIHVATVINFPAGTSALTDVLAEARAALAAGADEIDVVIPYRALLAGDAKTAATMVAGIKALMPEGSRLKTILETGVYPDEAAIRTAADLCIANGADFIKTSTGKLKQGASLAATAAMLEAIRRSGRAVGLKPSGGIRSLADASAYLAQAETIMGAGWATSRTFRFGASSLWDALAGVIEGRDSAAGSGY